MKYKLIVGLGNPGLQYAGTRHNIGENILRTILAGKYLGDDACELQEKPKFKALMCDVQVGDTKVFFALPTTYYNLSGESVRAICDFYKIDSSNVLVVHDELALPFGTIRSRIGGSDAGNNGVKSVIAHMGQKFGRVRVGVYNELRDQIDDADFVLSRFNSLEQASLPYIVDEVKTEILSFITNPEFGATTKRIKKK